MTPPNGEWELATYYTFSQHDLEIINRHRRDYNRLGFAVQLALLRYPGWSITDIKEIPDFLLHYLAKQLGRIEKTIFILDYISSESMRRRIQRGLNKGEAMNALARAIFFGKHGELRERALQDQLQRASALNILINTISVWNTVYLGKATDLLRSKGALREDLLMHMSPLGWEHINFLGEYRFDLKGVTTLESLRPLNQV
ncbi:Tn3 family transposase [Brevibacillus parabrevis]